ncbi:DUF3298 domain-containing protein [Schleiferia thermophila]|uniref:DUF3298 and DUF4163 domain-containing protein n=1 Tax=Schleiferia thermophila TaxID=884107 RepID=UPI003EEFC6F3
MKQLKLYPFTLFLFTIVNACQSEETMENSDNNLIDSVQYTIVTRSKEVGTCSNENMQCAKIQIQSLDIKSGITDQKAVNIELDIINEILMIEGNEAATAKNIDDLIDVLLDEYKNLISTIKDYFLPWEVNYTINVVNNNLGLLTVEINYYSYRGGAHGNEYIKYVNYNLFDGAKVRVDSAFDMSKEFLSLCEQIFRKKYKLDAKSSLSESGFYFNADKFYIPDNYYIRDNLLHFIYNRYEIAPYSEGIIEIQVPLSDVFPYIKSEVLQAFVRKHQT